jgi:hypothetical protein
MESNDSNIVESDSIRIEIEAPEFIVPLPENKPDVTATVLLNLCLTNNTSNPFRFKPYGTLIPELITLDGQIQNRQLTIQQQEDKIQTNISSVWGFKDKVTRFISNLTIQHERSQTIDTNYQLVEARWFRRFYIAARLCWKDNQLQLRVPATPEDFQNPTTPKYFWCFDALGAETYQLRFIYDPDNEPRLDPDLNITEARTGQEIALGQLATPLVSLHLVQPVESDSHAIEVEGVQFKLEMTETVLTSPSLLPGAKKRVKLGIRAINNRPILLHFERLNAIYPILLDPNLKVVEPCGDLMRLWVGNEPPYYSAKPGESVLFVLDGFLQRKFFKLRLAIPNEAAGFWYYDDLKPGTYQLAFIYVYEVGQPLLTPHIEDQSLEEVWIGSITTTFVEFRIVR